jgi:monodictyphenone polyketide synthase
MPINTASTTPESESVTNTMDIVYFSNEFPREDLQSLFRRLHNHSKGRQHPTLAHFLNEATWAIKNEIQSLPSELRQLIPPFTSILSWAEATELREGLICGAVDGVLLIVAQLATYIGYMNDVQGCMKTC